MVGSVSFDWLQVIIGLGNGLAPNMRQAIIDCHDDSVQWRTYVAQEGDFLTYSKISAQKSKYLQYDGWGLGHNAMLHHLCFRIFIYHIHVLERYISTRMLHES